eukprot:47744-Prorocentrum_minimum.AAC.1
MPASPISPLLPATLELSRPPPLAARYELRVGPGASHKVTLYQPAGVIRVTPPPDAVPAGGFPFARWAPSRLASRNSTVTRL